MEEGCVVDPGRGLAGDRASSRAAGEGRGGAVRLPVMLVPIGPELAGRTGLNPGLTAVGVVGRSLDADDGLARGDDHRAATGRPGRRRQQAIRIVQIALCQRRWIEVQRCARGDAGGVDRAGRRGVEEFDIPGGDDGDRAGAGAHQCRNIDRAGDQSVRIGRVAIDGDAAHRARRGYRRGQRHDRVGIDR